MTFKDLLHNNLSDLDYLKKKISILLTSPKKIIQQKRKL